MTPPRTATLLCAFGAALVAGCANPVDTATGECAVVGGGVAFALCKATGHTTQQCLAAAGITGAVGAVGCKIYASNLEARRKQLAADRYSLEGQIRYVQGLNEDVAKLNEALRSHVADATQQANALRDQIASKAIAPTQVAQRRRQLADGAQAARKQVESQRAALDEAQQFQARQRQPSPQLDAEIAHQTRLLADAQRQVDTLSSLSERV